MPVLPVLLEVTSIGGRTSALFCAAALCEYKVASARMAPQLPILSPMAQRSFVCARTRRTHRVKTKPDAKDAARYPCNGARVSRAECRGRYRSHGLRTGIAVTAAKDRSVWTPRPPVG